MWWLLEFGLPTYWSQSSSGGGCVKKKKKANAIKCSRGRKSSMFILFVSPGTLLHPPPTFSVTISIHLHHHHHHQRKGTRSHLLLYFTLGLPYSSPCGTPPTHQAATRAGRNVMQMFPPYVRSEVHTWADIFSETRAPLLSERANCIF